MELLLGQQVADSWLAQDVAGTLRVKLDLVAQIPHMGLQTGIGAVCFTPEVTREAPQAIRKVGPWLQSGLFGTGSGRDSAWPLDFMSFSMESWEVGNNTRCQHVGHVGEFKERTGSGAERVVKVVLC